MGTKYLLQLVQAGFQLAAIAGSEPRFAALLVFTSSAITTAPSARGLATITFDLCGGQCQPYASFIHTRQSIMPGRVHGPAREKGVNGWYNTFRCLHSSHETEIGRLRFPLRAAGSWSSSEW
jgi:hypothetical protein